MDRISRSHGWDKEILHYVLPMEQLVLSDKWALMLYPNLLFVISQPVVVISQPLVIMKCFIKELHCSPVQVSL